MDRLVGRDNASKICINSITVGLINTVSMIRTIAEDFLLSLWSVPPIYTLEELGLQVNVANGQTLDYSGCVVVQVSVPCNGKATVLVLCLVGHMTENNKEVPVIVGTNIINWLYQHMLDDTDEILTEWATTFKASESALTEPIEDGLSVKVSICPRVVRTNKPENSMHTVAHVQPVG